MTLPTRLADLMEKPMSSLYNPDSCSTLKQGAPERL